MKLTIALVICAFGTTTIKAENCPTGGEIFARGTSDRGKQAIVDAHNRYRQMIMNGEVPDQPQGKDLLTMRYDDILGDKARVVSDTCVMNHILASDERFWWVGQNLFIEWSSGPSDDQNWDKAVESWYNEYENYDYDSNASKNGKATGHYTQVVWASSEFIGCDYIYFYDNNQPDYPYAKMYSCNYGPGGNVGGQWPYERA